MCWSSRPGMPSKWKTVWLTLLWLEAVIPGADDMGLHFLFTEIEENIYSLINLLRGIIQTPSSIVAWRIPWTEESGRLHTVQGVTKVRHDLATKPPPPYKHTLWQINQELLAYSHSPSFLNMQIIRNKQR